MIVMKFGGSSVSSPERISSVVDIILSKKNVGVVVFSAFGGVTNNLIRLISSSEEDSELLLNALKTRHFEAIEELIPLKSRVMIMAETEAAFKQLQELLKAVKVIGELPSHVEAKVLGIGELLSSKIICEAIKAKGVEANFLDSRKLIEANGKPLRAQVNDVVTRNNIKQNVAEGKLHIVPGFVASNCKGEAMLLGRGGSDYTASIFGEALEAEQVEIWSDVNGMLTADPRLVSEASTISEMSYVEAFELSNYGAKVLYPPSILPVKESGIPVFLKNTFEPTAIGTKIGDELVGSEGPISGISSISDISLLNISGPGLRSTKGSASVCFKALQQADVNVVMVSQSCSEHSICLGIDSSRSENAILALNAAYRDEINEGKVNSVVVENDCSIVAIVGKRMKSAIGLSGKVFTALGNNGINVKAIAQGSSEYNLSVVVEDRDSKKAVNSIHEAFFSSSVKVGHLFVVGRGNVGSEFFKILNSRRSQLTEELGLNLRLVGISGNGKYELNPEGLLVDSSQELSIKGDISKFAKEAIALNLRNSIFIDITASENVALEYPMLLRNGFNVVACNKVAPSANLDFFEGLKESYQRNRNAFQYETCVGAALPIISTLQQLRLAGDPIHKVEAVLSGSLNFIFNNYNGTEPFAEVVEKALNEGYTEPDPLLDLGGVDVQRKLVILARECGLKIEMSDVENKSFLPNGSQGDLKWFEWLLQNEEHFKSLLSDAIASGTRLKVVGRIEKGKTSVQLLKIPNSHPFFELQGKDNIVAINTSRYPDQPLVIKGAGAGAEVTASGVFSDVLKILNQ